LNGGQPNENNMDVWIRAKYEQKQWVEKVGIMPDPSQIEVNRSLMVLFFCTEYLTIFYYIIIEKRRYLEDNNKGRETDTD
jgi:hypothetical protein